MRLATITARRSIGLAAVMAALGLGFTSCGTPPRGTMSAAAAASAPSASLAPVSRAELPQRVTVQGREGALSADAQARVIDRATAGAKGEEVALHLRTLAAQGEVDLYRGNAARLLVDGPATFGAMKAAIAQARQRVLLEMYIIEDAGVAAEIGSMLARKAEQGVTVALLYDAVGSHAADPAFFKALEVRGVAVCAFNPVNPAHRIGYWGINHRNHRKLMVVDSSVAFTGGINISQVYSSGSAPGRSKARSNDEDKVKEGWRDTQVELKGPVVPALAQSFEGMWQSQGCPALPAPAALINASMRTPAQAGDRIVKLLATDPSDERNKIYDAMLAAIQASRRSVHLTMAYFVPGDEMIGALCDAARRSVDVVLILPGTSDFKLVLHAGRSYYDQLLAAGVVIHEMEHAVLHAKTAVIDGVFSTVGSSNMDWRSFADNSELNAIVLGEDFGAEMETLFKRDRAVSPRVDPKAWPDRGLKQKFLEQVGRAAERWL